MCNRCSERNSFFESLHAQLDLKKQQFILWGSNRHIFEFQYMFSDILDILGYVLVDEDDKNIYGIAGKNFSLDKQRTSLAGCSVIVCDRTIDKYVKYVDSLRIGKIYYCEDFFELLDPIESKLIAERDIGVWGIGVTEEDFHKKYCDYGYEDQYPINFYIDSNENKVGKTYRDKVVQSPKFLHPKKHFIIVASIYYKDIKLKLEHMGFVEKIDFIPYTYVMTRPSLMMKTQFMCKNTYNFRCIRPFTLCDYAWYGVYACCWTKYPIGNPASDMPQESWNSTVAKLIRLSALTRTYIFCKMEQCGVWGINDTSNLSNYEVPQTLLCGLDDSCNLYCKSCRDEIRVAKGEAKEIRSYFADRLIDSGWLNKVDSLSISSRGEALASAVDRKIIFFDGAGQRKCIDIITNLNLWDENKLIELMERYSSVRFHCSIDALTKETYEKMRRGGNWDKVLRNLYMLSEYREKGKLDFLELRMIISRSNFKEVKDFVIFAKELGADKVYLMKMLKIYCWDEKQLEYYFKESMFTADGLPNKELLTLLMDPIMNDKIVVHDFSKYLCPGNENAKYGKR